MTATSPNSSFPRKRESSDFLTRRARRWIPAFAGMTALLLAGAGTWASSAEEPVEREYVAAPAAPAFQSWEDADKKSAGCVSCHTKSDRKTMHANEAVVLGCTDCHGGNSTVFSPPGETYSADDKGTLRQWSAAYKGSMQKA